MVVAKLPEVTRTKAIVPVVIKTKTIGQVVTKTTMIDRRVKIDATNLKRKTAKAAPNPGTTEVEEEAAEATPATETAGPNPSRARRNRVVVVAK